jgi:hypothetical protein
MAARYTGLRGRPARFRDGDRILVALEPLPGASLWSQRFPDRDALAVAARGEAFLRAPDAASLEALTGLVSNAQLPLARAALARLAQVPDLESRMSPIARERLGRALADRERAKELRQGVLRLVGERQLRSLRATVEPYAREGSPLEPQALAAQGEAGIGSASAALFDGDTRVREAAVLGLASLGAAAVPTLEGLVERRVAEEAKAPLAALALTGRPGREALERIAARHPDEQVRALARVMLGRKARPPH